MTELHYREEDGKPLSQVIRNRLKQDNKRFWAGDNISEYISDVEKETLINEATGAFEQVLDSLLIDRENDPNSKGTARRLAKMYFNEIMAGRYEPALDATAFPNDSEDRYEGMLVVRSELRSMCSHHHQPVAGVAYIGIIAAEKLILTAKVLPSVWPKCISMRSWQDVMNQHQMQQHFQMTVKTHTQVCW